MESMDRTCAECGKTLKGRLDKKFCDDYCRNAYNNRRNADQNNYVRNLNNSLRRNRRILEGLVGDRTGMGKCTRQKLQQAGFDFSYHTHQYTNRKGNVYFFCYEFGYLPLEGDWVLVVKRGEEKG